MSLKFIDKYEIVSTLGRGSMGVVYKAKDPEIGRLVAIKTLKSVFMGDDAAGNEALQRFRQESRSAGRLHHPNIVTIFEAGRTDNGSPYIVMEFIEGKSFEAILSEGGALEPLAAIHYLAQVASAIDYAHSQTVIHRDIKPSNILVDARHRPYLLDFGVAKLSDTSLTPAGTVVGTPSYMSPEQIRGQQLDGRTDLFSLAVVAFEIFTGSRPFPGADFTTVVSNIIHKEPLSFSDVGCNLPAPLEKVLQHSLAKDRDKRFKNALEFIDACAQVWGVVVDGSGIIGGYNGTSKIADVAGKASSVKPTSSKKEENRSAGAQTASATGKSAAIQPAKSGVKDDINFMREEERNSRDLSSGGGQKIARLFIGGLALMLVGLIIYSFASGGEEGSDRASKEEEAPINYAETNVQTEQPVEQVEKNVESVAEVIPPLEQASPQLVDLRPLKPIIPSSGFTESAVSALRDGEILWLISLENNDLNTIRLGLMEAAKRSAPEFLPAICEAVKHSDFKARVEALKILSRSSKLQEPSVVNTIISALGDSEFLVRGFAAKTLASIKSKEAVMALEKQARDEKNAVVLKVINDSLSQLRAMNM